MLCYGPWFYKYMQAAVVKTPGIMNLSLLSCKAFNIGWCQNIASVFPPTELHSSTTATKVNKSLSQPPLRAVCWERLEVLTLQTDLCSSTSEPPFNISASFFFFASDQHLASKKAALQWGFLCSTEQEGDKSVGYGK